MKRDRRAYNRAYREAHRDEEPEIPFMGKTSGRPLKGGMKLLPPA